jgi:6-pyruvoyltetrahydropterin/6-carboxytetrahydropterin synthase
VVEVDLQADTLDARGMVADFTDVKHALKTWIDETLDHRMLLRKDDPLASMLEQQGEPSFLMDENPTAENIAKLIYSHARTQGLPILDVRVWETPTSCASYSG